MYVIDNIYHNAVHSRTVCSYYCMRTGMLQGRRKEISSGPVLGGPDDPGQEGGLGSPHRNFFNIPLLQMPSERFSQHKILSE